MQFDQLKRHEFITLLGGGGVAAWGIADYCSAGCRRPGAEWTWVW